MDIMQKVNEYRSWSDEQLNDALKRVLSVDNKEDKGTRVIELNVIIMALEARGLSVDPKIKDMAKKGIDSMVSEAKLDAASRGVQVFGLGMPENLRLRNVCKKCGEPWTPEDNKSLSDGLKCPKCNA